MELRQRRMLGIPLGRPAPFNNLRARSRTPRGSGGEDTSKGLSVKVMFIYMQITKNDKRITGG